MRKILSVLPVVVLTLVAFGFLITCGQKEEQAAPKDDSPRTASPPAVENIWTVGVLTGPSLFQLSAPQGVSNPVMTGFDVTDLDVNIAAHPFLIAADGGYYLFFTAKSSEKHEGGIGMASSADGLNWEYRQIVIDEPYDLSYPHVFQWQGDYYMTPEAHTETSVRLYKATNFPAEWTYQGDILTGDHYISPTIFSYDGMLWMYAAKAGNETLRLFHASELMGTWTEHPMSPIIENDLNTARPAGSTLVVDGKLYRIGQDCEPTYGNAARAFEVTELTTTTYAEKIIETPLVQASGEGWNSDAMHHLDAVRLSDGSWLAVTDALGARKTD